MKGKKGQVYVFAALLICVVLVSLTTAFFIHDTTESAGGLVENYEREIFYVTNNALYEKEPVMEELGSFTDRYIMLGEQKGFDLEIALVYNYQNKTCVMNKMNRTIEFESAGETFSVVDSNCTEDNAHLLVNVINQTYEFDERGVHGIVMTENNNNIEVFRVEL